VQQPDKIWVVVQEGRQPVHFSTYENARVHQRQRLAEAGYQAKILIIEERLASHGDSL
jgi:hypothetical protein